MSADAEVGHLYQTPLFVEIYQQSCLGMMSILGMGMALTWNRFGFAVPVGSEPPPDVGIVQRW